MLMVRECAYPKQAAVIHRHGLAYTDCGICLCCNSDISAVKAAPLDVVKFTLDIEDLFYVICLSMKSRVHC